MLGRHEVIRSVAIYRFKIPLLLLTHAHTLPLSLVHLLNLSHPQPLTSFTPHTPSSTHRNMSTTSWVRGLVSYRKTTGGRTLLITKLIDIASLLHHCNGWVERVGERREGGREGGREEGRGKEWMRKEKGWGREGGMRKCKWREKREWGRIRVGSEYDFTRPLIRYRFSKFRPIYRQFVETMLTKFSVNHVD